MTSSLSSLRNSPPDTDGLGEEPPARTVNAVSAGMSSWAPGVARVAYRVTVGVTGSRTVRMLRSNPKEEHPRVFRRGDDVAAGCDGYPLAGRSLLAALGRRGAAPGWRW